MTTTRKKAEASGKRASKQTATSIIAQVERMCDVLADVSANQRTSAYYEMSKDERKAADDEYNLIHLTDRDMRGAFEQALRAGKGVAWDKFLTTRKVRVNGQSVDMTGVHLTVNADIRTALGRAIAIAHGYGRDACDQAKKVEVKDEANAIVNLVNKRLGALKDKQLIRKVVKKKIDGATVEVKVVQPVRLDICICPTSTAYMHIEVAGAYTHNKEMVALVADFNKAFLAKSA